MQVWTCNTGSFVGFESDECTHVRGIRYAISERYDNPIPYLYTEGIHNCIDAAPFAVQLPSVLELSLQGTTYENLPQEESCQYLSITIPNGTLPGDNLPVMVWFHGGAYRNGGCDAPGYNRALLAQEGKVIVVGVNYRLGILGFVRNREGNLANNGLLDAIEALRWLQTNIASFGGDPQKITLFGQSAGADLVRCIMLAHHTDNLYQRAIIQSDPLGIMSNRALLDRKVLEELNTLPLNASTQELRSAQAHIMSHVKEKSYAKYMIFGPHYGVEPLPEMEHFFARLQEIAAKHELLLGCTTREVAIYIGMRASFKLFDGIPPTRWIIEHHVRRISRSLFSDPSSAFARSYVQAGGIAYEYSFFWMENESPMGAGHAMDLLPLFGSGKAAPICSALGLTPNEVLKSGKPMRAIWIDFAKTGTIAQMEIPGMLHIWKCNT